MPGPRPTPTYLKLLRGNPGRRPINKNEPKPEIPAKQPAPPAWLSAYALEEWKRVAPELWRINLLTKVDVAVFAMYCEAYARWRTAEEALAVMASRDPVMRGLIARSKAGTAMENPLAYISRRAAQEMLRCAGEFGLTPAARSRISIGAPPPGPSKFGDLLA